MNTDKTLEDYKNSLMTGIYGIVTGTYQINVTPSNLISLAEINSEVTKE
ncbi:MAG: hypothetical protein PWQ10_661 [Patescibacteria group bacterium]|nr:hypothetical protein [Patescibacteria group bacterium]